MFQNARQCCLETQLNFGLWTTLEFGLQFPIATTTLPIPPARRWRQSSVPGWPVVNQGPRRQASAGSRPSVSLTISQARSLPQQLAHDQHARQGWPILLRLAATAVAIEKQQTIQLVFTFVGCHKRRCELSRLFAAKHDSRETLLRRTEQQRIAAASIRGQPLSFTDVTRNDQAGAPAERLQHAFVFLQTRPHEWRLPDSDLCPAHRPANVRAKSKVHRAKRQSRAPFSRSALPQARHCDAGGDSSVRINVRLAASGNATDQRFCCNSPALVASSLRAAVNSAGSEMFGSSKLGRIRDSGKHDCRGASQVRSAAAATLKLDHGGQSLFKTNCRCRVPGIYEFG